MVIDEYSRLLGRDKLLIKMPQPIPEPPRIVSTRPLLSDISVCTDRDQLTPLDSSSTCSSREKGNQGKNGGVRSKKSFESKSCTCHHHNQLFIDILKSQEEHIEQLSKRMAQLVKLNKAQIEKTKEPERKSVATMTDLQEPVGHPNSPRRELRPDDPRKVGTSDMCSSTDSDFYSTSLILTVASSKDSDNEEALYEKILREVDDRLQQSKSMRQRPKRTPTSSPTYRSKIANFHHPRRYSPSQESILINQLTEKYLKDNKSRDRFKNRE